MHRNSEIPQVGKLYYMSYINNTILGKQIPDRITYWRLSLDIILSSNVQRLPMNAVVMFLYKKDSWFAVLYKTEIIRFPDSLGCMFTRAL